MKREHKGYYGNVEWFDNESNGRRTELFEIRGYTKYFQEEELEKLSIQPIQEKIIINNSNNNNSTYPKKEILCVKKESGEVGEVGEVGFTPSKDDFDKLKKEYESEGKL